jgi:RNA polymerase sigma-70 factor (sigma-E family)
MVAVPRIGGMLFSWCTTRQLLLSCRLVGCLLPSALPRWQLRQNELSTTWVWGRWDRLSHMARGKWAPRSGMTAGEPGGTAARPIHVTETLVADTAALGSVPADWDADRAVTALYSTHYRSLVRLAALLVRDVATAEEVVQDSFVAMHGGWRRLRDSDKALSYLRQSVVNRSRSVLRHRVVVDRNAPKPAPDMPSAEHGAIALLERSAVVSALRTLPPRQREALVLRYYGDMSEAQIASIMGISRGAVKSHTARAMSALRSVLEREG